MSDHQISSKPYLSTTDHDPGLDQNLDLDHDQQLDFDPLETILLWNPCLSDLNQVFEKLSKYQEPQWQPWTFGHKLHFHPDLDFYLNLDFDLDFDLDHDLNLGPDLGLDFEPDWDHTLHLEFGLDLGLHHGLAST